MSATLNNLSQVPRYDDPIAAAKGDPEVRENRRQVRDYNELRRAKSSLHELTRTRENHRYGSPRKQVYNNWAEYKAENPGDELINGSVWAQTWSKRSHKKREEPIGSGRNVLDSWQSDTAGVDLVDTYRYVQNSFPVSYQSFLQS